MKFANITSPIAGKPIRSLAVDIALDACFESLLLCFVSIGQGNVKRTLLEIEMNLNRRLLHDDTAATVHVSRFDSVFKER